MMFNVRISAILLTLAAWLPACAGDGGAGPGPGAGGSVAGTASGGAPSGSGGAAAGSAGAAASGGAAAGAGGTLGNSGSGGVAAGAGGATAGAAGTAAGAGGAAAGASGSGGSGGAQAGASGSAGAGGQATGTPVVDRAATLDILRRVANYEIGRFGTTTNNNWVRAVFHTGLLALYRETNEARYRDYTRSWGQANNWALGPDASRNTRFADNQTCIQSYAELYLMDPVPANDVMLNSARTVFDAMITMPRAGRVEWWWCDALFMAPPAMVSVANATGRPQYIELMHTMFWDTHAYLYDPTQHLFWRDNSFRNTSFWSRGNGWVVGGIARVLEVLPAADARRGDYETLLRQMTAKLRTVQGTDGFWRSNLLNPSAFPNPESSGTAFFCFGMAWGINHGVLDAATYLEPVTRAWTALTGAVQPEGRLGWVQAVGAQPGATTENNTNDYATGAFLLAGIEMLKLRRTP